MTDYRNSWLPEVFGDFFNTGNMNRVSATAPAINVLETADEYIVELAVPGMTREDFEVNINDDGDLHIKMEHKSEPVEKAHYLRREFAYGRYEQTLVLPEDVDHEKIGARVADGVLTVTLPKLRPNQQKITRNIEIG